MTYKEKMVKEHPTVDSNFILFSCPGNYFEGAPHCDSAETCPATNPNNKTKCIDCWNTEIPTGIPEINTKKIAARVKELYNAFRDEGLNHQEAFDITKIIISAEVQHTLRYDDKEINT